MITLRPLERREMRRSVRAHKSVDVIVIGRNGAEFLNACLRSVKTQTFKPQSLIYVDDASEDGSADIARAHGFTVLALKKRIGMSKARMKGVEITEAEFILFVDCDNTLPRDYLETMVREIGDSHVFVYSGKHFIGDGKHYLIRMKFHTDGKWIPPEADRARLWWENYVDTCALVRRDAFMAVGGWKENQADTMFDWDLFLRMSAVGTHVRSKALLDYRTHGSNWSERERGISPIESWGLVRRAAATITVACMWSGRIPELATKWLRAVERSLKCAGKTAELLIMDDSKDGFGLIAPCKVFTAVNIRRIRRDQGTATRRPDRRATAEFLSAVCNEVLDRAAGDVVWFVEDDVIVQNTAADRMLHALLQKQLRPRTAVGGWFRNRHEPDKWVAAHVNGTVQHLRDPSSFHQDVHFTGTGCLMVLRDLLKGIRFGTEWRHEDMVSPAHDWVFAWKLHQRGTPVTMVPGVICRHYLSATNWV